jgi:hypothetical protein
VTATATVFIVVVIFIRAPVPPSAVVVVRPSMLAANNRLFLLDYIAIAAAVTAATSLVCGLTDPQRGQPFPSVI